jgi:hypothetical protein
LSGRDLAWLERRRAELFALISQVGDCRRGALNVMWHKCGKPTRSLTVPLCTVRIEYPAAGLWPGIRSRPSSACWLAYRFRSSSSGLDRESSGWRAPNAE